MRAGQRVNWDGGSWELFFENISKLFKTSLKWKEKEPFFISLRLYLVVSILSKILSKTCFMRGKNVCFGL